MGLVAGGVGAFILVLLLRYYWVPDYLQTSFTLMIVVVVFALSNQLQQESGLLSATLMGIVLANQRKAGVQHIVVFKETLTVLLISSLFILLAARVDLNELALIDLRSYLFVALMILLVRPLSVFAGHLGHSPQVGGTLLSGLDGSPWNRSSRSGLHLFPAPGTGGL